MRITYFPFFLFHAYGTLNVNKSHYKKPSDLLFFSADNCRYISGRDWSRRALRLRRPDPMVGDNPRVQSAYSPYWRVSRLADKTRLHSSYKWHSTLRVLHVCCGSLLFVRFHCGFRNNYVSKCVLWGNRCADYCCYNNDPCTSICEQGECSFLEMLLEVMLLIKENLL